LKNVMLAIILAQSTRKIIFEWQRNAKEITHKRSNLRDDLTKYRGSNIYYFLKFTPNFNKESPPSKYRIVCSHHKNRDNKETWWILIENSFYPFCYHCF
jgi:hypothetical protein